MNITYDVNVVFVAVKKYRVKVHTGDKMGAGTDANVTVSFHGPLGSSSRKAIDNKKDNFERGK